MLLPENYDELALVGPPASPRQVKYAKSLALDQGRSISLPQSSAQADVLLDCLLVPKPDLSEQEAQEAREERQREEWDARGEVAAGTYATAGWD